jgi:nucleoside-diphosphate-sugar epimerase
VLVTGAAGGVGRRVVELLGADATVDAVIALDVNDMPRGFDPTRVEFHRSSVATAPLEELLGDVGCIIHLAFATDTERRVRASELTNIEGTRRLLAAASAAGVEQIVLMSSAIVYGAWPNNALPLTEDAPIRPNPDFAYALQQAQREQLAVDWRGERDERALAVLRPCLGLGPDRSPWLARSLAAAAGMRLAEDDPPQQFLHLDDLAAAIVVARRERLDGVYNVAPDGWIRGETVRELAVARPRLRLPATAAHLVARARWRFQRGPIPPGLLPYTSYPWVVANDRMKAAGWRPRRTSEQAYFAGTEAKWWTLLTPSRKQELAMGAAGTGIVGVAAIVALIIRRAVRRARNG